MKEKIKKFVIHRTWRKWYQPKIIFSLYDGTFSIYILNKVFVFLVFKKRYLHYCNGCEPHNWITEPLGSIK